MSSHPRLVHTVLDATDPRGLAEFYRRLMGYEYRPGDEVPAADGEEEGWLVLRSPQGHAALAFQRVDVLHRTTWPSPDVPMQMHLCFQVDDPGQLDAHRARAEELGATLVLHRTDEPDEPLFVLADPAGHPFCLYAHP